MGTGTICRRPHSIPEALETATRRPTMWPLCLSTRGHVAVNVAHRTHGHAAPFATSRLVVAKGAGCPWVRWATFTATCPRVLKHKGHMVGLLVAVSRASGIE